MELSVADNVEVASLAVKLDTAELGRKRFREQMRAYVPSVVLNADGTIQQISPSAMHLLEYRSDQKMDRSFFAHVHGKNLYQVMRDVADMVCYGKTQATWLLRMRTGKGRWRWYKATVRNRLEEEDAIQVQLDEQNTW